MEQILLDSGFSITRAWEKFKTSYSGFKDVKKAIKLAKGSGMAVMLAFHYSDIWRTRAGKLP